jgi:hypothetical protein
MQRKPPPAQWIISLFGFESILRITPKSRSISKASDPWDISLTMILTRVAAGPDRKIQVIEKILATLHLIQDASEANFLEDISVFLVHRGDPESSDLSIPSRAGLQKAKFSC